MQQLSRRTTGQKIFRKAGWICGLALLLGVGLGAASPAHAVTVAYEIQNGGPVSGFSYSTIHDASGTNMLLGGNSYWAGGAILGNSFVGTLFGDQTVSGTQTSLTGINGTVTASGGLTLTFTGGSLLTDTSISPYASGSLDVNFSGPVTRTETFYFHPLAFTGGAPSNGPNGFDGSQFFLWGNNWNNGPAGTEPAIGNTGTLNSTRLGIDLKGTIVTPPAPVPLPAAVLLFGSGLAGLLAGKARRLFV